MRDVRKITVFIPRELLDTARGYIQEGVTETLRIALERLNKSEWSRRMLELRGKIKPDIDLDSLREDREFNGRGDVV